MKTIVVLSGGLDSTVLLAHLHNNQHEIHTISFDYGQRHRRELESAKLVAKYYEVASHTLVDLSDGLSNVLAGSSQTSPEIEVPEGHYAEESMKLTVVPNRNMIMSAIAIGYAISIKAQRVALAVHAGDHAIYPDCRPTFYKALQAAADIGNYDHIELFAPFIDWPKGAIVEWGSQLQVPFELTWSCYKGLAVHCGKCGTCVERREAFNLAGVHDPTVYATSSLEVA